MIMEKLPQISEAEFEIMKILWTEDPLSTNEVCERAQKTHTWNQKTIHTLLVISYEQRGRMYYYSPLISREEYLEQENHVFLNRFYNGEVAPMLSSLLAHTEISDTELKELYAMIDSKLKSGENS